MTDIPKATFEDAVEHFQRDPHNWPAILDRIEDMREAAFVEAENSTSDFEARKAIGKIAALNILLNQLNQ